MSLKQEQNTEPTGEFAASIRNFRSAVTHVAGRETAAPMLTANWLAPARRRQHRHHQHLVLGWVCAAVLCAATTLPLMLHQRGPEARPAAQTTTATAGMDAAPQSGLLEQVDEDVSESVPSSLAPLAEMDNMDSTNTASDSSSDQTALSTENTDGR